MPKRNLAASLALLALPFFTTGCMATVSVEVDRIVAPEMVIRDHAGIGLYDLSGESEVEAGLARRLTGQISSALSDGTQGFILVSASEREEITAKLKDAGLEWDSFGTEHSQKLMDLFGRKVPMTGAFQGALIVSFDEGEVTKVRKPFSKNKETGEWSHIFRREGTATLTVTIDFLDIGTGSKKTEVFVSKTGELHEVADTKNVPAISYTRALDKCLNSVLEQFERKWVISKQRVSIPLFVGDGTFHMPWEGDEYPLLARGFERMENGQYAFAAEDYAEQAKLLRGGDAEMEARTWYDQGVAAEVAGQLEEALGFYAKAAKASTGKVIGAGHARCQAALVNADKLNSISGGADGAPEL